ncbi:MAG: DUF1861 family protein [Candidatus Paceibacterota bacterium]
MQQHRNVVKVDQKPAFSFSDRVVKLLKKYDPENVHGARRLTFGGVSEGRDVYNITAPFVWNGKKYLLGRVESRDSEVDTETVLFANEATTGEWIREEAFASLSLQDPFIAQIHGQVVIGGVEVAFREKTQRLTYRTVFYRGDNPFSVTRFARGPWKMKGVRPVELTDGRIGVFTRPQGRIGRRGRIGFTIIGSLNELTPRRLLAAPLLSKQFARGEWGGVNEATCMSDGRIQVLGHVARFSQSGLRHYYPIAFLFDPYSRGVSDFNIIGCRSDLPAGETKREDLHDVVYPGGIVRDGEGSARLYVGVSDAEAVEVVMNDPFTGLESLVLNPA